MSSMIRQSTSFYCRRCEHIRSFTKRGFNHRRHLFATALTFGLWAPAWYYLHFRNQRRSWRCTICGGRQRPSGEPADTSEIPESTTPSPADPRRFTIAAVPVEESSVAS